MQDGTNIVNALPAFRSGSVALFSTVPRAKKGELIDFTSDCFCRGGWSLIPRLHTKHSSQVGHGVAQRASDSTRLRPLAVIAYYCQWTGFAPSAGCYRAANVLQDEDETPCLVKRTISLTSAFCCSSVERNKVGCTAY